MITKTNFNQIPSFEYITQISPASFEYFTKYLLDAIGYERTQVTKKYGENHADRGIDCITYKGEDKILVQAKKWNKGYKGALPVAVIREHGGCMLRDKVNSGIITTTLEIDNADKIEAQQMNIRLIGRNEIIEIMKTVNLNFDKKSALFESRSLSQSAFTKKSIPKKEYWLIRLIKWLIREVLLDGKTA